MHYLTVILLMHCEAVIFLVVSLTVMKSLWETYFFDKRILICLITTAITFIMCILRNSTLERAAVAILPVSNQVEIMEVVATKQKTRKGRESVTLRDFEGKSWRLEPMPVSGNPQLLDNNTYQAMYSQQGLFESSRMFEYRYVNLFDGHMRLSKKMGLPATVAVRRTSTTTYLGYGVAIPASASGWELSYSWPWIPWSLLFLLRLRLYFIMYKTWKYWKRSQANAHVLEVVSP